MVWGMAGSACMIGRSGAELKGARDSVEPQG